MASGYIWIAGGHRIHLDPSPDDFKHWNVGTIVHALSRLGRWTGHSVGPFPLSVAQHSVVVSYLTPPPFQLEGLFHDAAEAYLGDVSSPVKRAVNSKNYKALTNKWDQTFARRLELSTDRLCHAYVKQADRLCQFHEARLLLGVRREELRAFGAENPKFGEGWGSDPHNMASRLPSGSWEFELRPKQPEQAEALFMKRYAELRAERPFALVSEGVTIEGRRA